MKDEQPILNLSNPLHQKLLIADIKRRKGLHKVEITKCRDQRSLAQNAYYWGVVLPVIAAWLTDAWGEEMDADGAHAFLKDEYLRRPKINHHTGEVMGHAPIGTRNLNTAEFADYLDKIIRFAGEYGVEVPPAAHFETALA